MWHDQVHLHKEVEQQVGFWLAPAEDEIQVTLLMTPIILWEALERNLCCLSVCLPQKITGQKVIST